jgi:hypothetical protein
MMFDEVTTARLRLVPFDDDTARAVLGGDLSGVDAVEGWPHDGPLTAYSTPSIWTSRQAGWITMNGRVIGDCGTHGSADVDGAIEIGYALAGQVRDRATGRRL